MKVRISDYNPDWPKMFEEEVQLITKEFPLSDYRVEHTGSTAVKDLKGKPVIDIMIGVPALPDHLSPTIEHLSKFGYEYMESFNALIPERRFFQKDKNGVRTHQVHLVSVYSHYWNRLIFFRDYLRANPEIRQQYEALKIELSQKEWDSVSDYSKAKTDFVTAIEQLMPVHKK